MNKYRTHTPASNKKAHVSPAVPNSNPDALAVLKNLSRNDRLVLITVAIWILIMTIVLVNTDRSEYNDTDYIDTPVDVQPDNIVLDSGSDCVKRLGIEVCKYV